MSTPEDALARARRAAADKRQRYSADRASAPTELDEEIAPGEVTPELLREWAVVQVDPGALYSARRLGAPVTLVKRMLLRLMRQYLAELEARQTRFNLALLEWLEQRERQDPR